MSEQKSNNIYIDHGTRVILAKGQDEIIVSISIIKALLVSSSKCNHECLVIKIATELILCRKIQILRPRMTAK